MAENSKQISFSQKQQYQIVNRASSSTTIQATMATSDIKEEKIPLRIEKAQGIGMSFDQFSRLLPLIQSSFSFIQPTESREYKYTQIAYAIGGKCNEEFGGKWVCICGHYNNEKEEKLEFSFSVSAIRFQCFIVNREYFLYIGQIYDPLAPIAHVAAVNNEWISI